MAIDWLIDVQMNDIEGSGHAKFQLLTRKLSLGNGKYKKRQVRIGTRFEL